jgi:carbonic anhydrase
MRTVEIIYRYGAQDAPVRPRPTDSDTARQRLDEGNQAFAALLDGPADDDGTATTATILDLANELAILDECARKTHSPRSSAAASRTARMTLS